MSNENATVYSEISGDWNVNIVECGMTDDADSMVVGWLYVWHHSDHSRNRVTGLTWDSYRILVDVGQPLQAREVEALLSAGFIVDESFYPFGGA